MMVRFVDHVDHFFAKNHPGQGKLFAKKGGVGGGQ